MICFCRKFTALVIVSFGAILCAANSDTFFADNPYICLGIPFDFSGNIHDVTRARLAEVKEASDLTDGQRAIAVRKINAAWNILSSPELRAAHDASEAIRGTGPFPVVTSEEDTPAPAVGSFADFLRQDSQEGLSAYYNDPLYQDVFLSLRNLRVSERKLLLPFLRRPEEFLRVLDLPPPSEPFARDIRLLALYWLDEFLMTNPSWEQFVAYRQLIGSVGLEGNDVEALVEATVELARSPSQFLFAFEHGWLGDVRPTLGLGNPQLNSFLRTKPTAFQLNALLARMEDRWAGVDPLQRQALASQELSLRQGLLGRKLSTEELLILLDRWGFSVWDKELYSFLRSWMHAFYSRSQLSVMQRREATKLLSGWIWLPSASLSPTQRHLLHEALLEEIRDAAEVAVLMDPPRQLRVPATIEVVLAHHRAHPEWYWSPVICHQLLLLFR